MIHYFYVTYQYIGNFGEFGIGCKVFKSNLPFLLFNDARKKVMKGQKQIRNVVLTSILEINEAQYNEFKEKG